MTTIGGLPAHVLLVHAVVVLVPLTAVLLVLVVAFPAVRRQLAVLTAVLAAATLVIVPLTTSAGEWLEHRVPATALIRAHTQLGGSMLPWAAGLFLVAAAVVARDVIARRRGAAATVPVGGLGAAHAAGEARSDPGPGGIAATVVIAVLAVVVAVGSTVTVYRIGDSGARAAWTGKFSEQELPRPEHRAPGG